MFSGIPCQVENEVERAFRHRNILRPQRCERKFITGFFLSVDIQMRTWWKPCGAEEWWVLPAELRCNVYPSVTDDSHCAGGTPALHPLFRSPLELFSAAGNLTNSLDKLAELVPFHWVVADEPKPASCCCGWSCFRGTVLWWSLLLPFLLSYEGRKGIQVSNFWVVSFKWLFSLWVSVFRGLGKCL